MPRVGIVTDSTNCLPPDFITKYDIRVVPVGMVIDGKLYRDQIDISLAEFWKMFNELHVEPTTNAASMGDFYNAFNQLSETTDSMICVMVSKVLSATHESTFQARKLIKSEKPHLNIEIIDSKTCAGALGYIVLEAARAAWENEGFQGGSEGGA